MILQMGMAGRAFKQGREMLLIGFSFKQQFMLGETLLQSGVMYKVVAICVISALTVGVFASLRVHYYYISSTLRQGGPILRGEWNRLVLVPVPFRFLAETDKRTSLP